MMAEQEKTCQHCGAPFQGPTSFCCRGCEYVHQLILDEGFDRYYDLRDRNLPPVGVSAFYQRDDRDLVERWKSSEEVAPGVVRRDYEIKGISCVGCVWLIERLFQRKEGAVGIEIDPQHGKVVLEAERDFDLGGFAAEIQRFGYTLREWAGFRSDATESRSTGGKIGVCAFLALNAMAFTLPFYLGMDWDDRLAPLLQFGAVILATFSVLIGGSYFFRRAIGALRVGALHIDLPIALGLAVAYVGSFVGWLTKEPDLFYFDFVAIFTLLMLVGRWLQERVTEQHVHQGFEAQPSEQQVECYESGGGITSLSVRDLKRSMQYRVATAAWVPVSSKLCSEGLLASLESINGEAEPRAFAMGDVVPSGAVVLSSGARIRLEAQEDWGQSLLKRLFEIQSTGKRESGRMESILKIYISVVLVLAMLGLVLWGVGMQDWKRGFQVAISVLVVSCPCAIGLAYPRVNDQCARWLRSRGVFVRLHSMWGRLNQVRKVYFDKTGTLTLETLDLLNPEVLGTLNPVQRQALYYLVDRNLHPVGRSLKEHLLTLHPKLVNSESEGVEVRETVGFGVAVEWDGRHYELVRSVDAARLGQSDLLEAGRCVASFGFRDSVRRDVRACVDWFERQQLPVTILSGDTRERVERLVASLGLPKERGLAGMSPQEKANWVQANEPLTVLMVGDGANDALAFEQAGCRATPVIGRGVLEHHSDFFFLGQGVRGVVDVFRLASVRGRTLRELLTLTISYNVAVVFIALLGAMNPLLAAVLMPLSSIVTGSWVTIRLASARLDRLMRDGWGRL
jgi:P-type Cu2+ transporter